MTVKLLAAGVAAAAVAAAGLASGAAQIGSAGPASVQVRHVVFGAPLPLDPPPVPAPPAPPEPAPPVTPGAPLPTPDEVSGMLTRLTDAGISYKEKENLVENGIEPGDGHLLDHDLRKAYRDGELPYTFDVLNVAPGAANQAVATTTISGPKTAPQTIPMTLVDQGSWVLSHDSATALLQTLANH